MVELPVVRVDFEEAQLLADMDSVRQDLSFVIEFGKRLVSLSKEGSDDHVLIRCLWNAALVAYVRCFSTGKRRFGLKEAMVAGLPGDPVGFHRWLKNMRDKHVAHAVNPFEEVSIGLVLSQSDKPERSVLGVARLSKSWLTPDVQGIENLVKFAQFLIRETDDKCKEAEASVLNRGNSLPIDQLYELPLLKTVAPGPDEAGQVRP